MRRAHVIVPTALAHGFDYAVPEGVQVAPGMVVEVPLGTRSVIGIVAGEGVDDVPEGKLRPLTRAFSASPGFSAGFMRYLAWVADYTLSPLGAVYKMALPVPKAFIKPPRVAFVPPQMRLSPHPLSPEQQSLVERIVTIPEHVHETLVLDGITGSGKTELYYGAIEAHLKRCERQSQILVMLPEIALTHQWLARFERHFGFQPVVWHSGVGDATRRRNYLAVMEGKARVVVGARSALFLPFADLSLIVVDEEHEPSYKQEEGVSYHARDMAVARGAMEQVPVLLVSATPSLETQVNIESGKYRSLHLSARYGGAALPEVHLVDMRAEELERGAFLSPTLRHALMGALERGEQSLLFLNRRGYAPLLLCRHCGHRFQCAQCSAWLVLHKGRKKLQCHHCGFTEPEPHACPACKQEGTLAACGPGVERVAEEVRDMFIDAVLYPLPPGETRDSGRVRADAASTEIKEALPQPSPGGRGRTVRISLLSSDHAISPEEIDAIIAGERDIIIGTQMVAKGHHFPHLSTVGVVDADLGLQGGDLRASERSFQLLHQLSGRAGRAQVKGHVYLQTFQPEHPVMQALGEGEAARFYALEREGRELAQWPPFGQLASLLFDGPDETEVRRVAQMVAQAAPRDARIRVLGPAPAALSRLKGQYRYRILVKAPRGVHLQRMLSDWLGALSIPRRVRVKTDVNPYSFV